MTFTDIYTAIDNSLTDQQRIMDMMDADCDYDLDFVKRQINKLENNG